MCAIQFNDYAERCCLTLEKTTIETDKTLAALARLQHSVEQFRVVTCWFNMTQRQRGSGYEFIYNIFRQSSSNTEILHHVRTWDAKISSQWNATPESVKTRALCPSRRSTLLLLMRSIGLLTVQYGYARVCLYECCLEESLFNSVDERHEVLRNCISAIRFLNDALAPLSLDPLVLLDVPAHMFAQSNHNTFLALLLCSIKCGDNSVETIDRALNLREYFAGTADRLVKLLASVPEEQLPAFYKRLVPMARGVQKWFAARLRNGGEAEREEQGSDGFVMPDSELDVNFWGQFLNVEGDEWLQDMLALDESHVGLL